MLTANLPNVIRILHFTPLYRKQYILHLIAASGIHILTYFKTTNLKVQTSVTINLSNIHELIDDAKRTTTIHK